MGRKKFPKKTEEGKAGQEQQQPQVQQSEAGSSQAPTHQRAAPPVETPQQAAAQLEETSRLPGQERPSQERILPESASVDSSQQGAKSKRNRRKRQTSEQQEEKVSSEQQLSQQVSGVNIHDEPSSPVSTGSQQRDVRDRSSQEAQGSLKGKAWQGKTIQQPGGGQDRGLQQHGREQERGSQQPRETQPFRSDQQRITPVAQDPEKGSWRERGSQPRFDQDRGSQQPRGAQEARDQGKSDFQGRGSQQPRGGQDRRPQQSRGDQSRGSQQPQDDRDRGSKQMQSDQERAAQEGGPGRIVWQERGSQQPRSSQDRDPQRSQDRAAQDPGKSTWQDRGLQQHIGQPDRGSQQPRGEQERGQQGRGDQFKGPQQSRGVGGRGQQDRSQQPRGMQQNVPPGFQRTQEQPESGKPAWQKPGRQPEVQQPRGMQQNVPPVFQRPQEQPESGKPAWQKPSGRQPEVQQPSSAQQIQKSSDKTVQERSSQQQRQQQPRPVQPPKEASSGLELAVPQRKKLNSAGTAGRRIRIETNHLALTLKNLKTAIHYDVTLEPDTPKKLLRVAVEAFRVKYYPNRYPAFDGRKNMYSSAELPVSDPFSGEVVVKDDDREKNYKITIKFAAMVDLSEVSRYFEAVATNRHLVTPQEAVQCLDIVLRSAPSLNCIPVGRSFFTQPGRIVELGDGMEMYYGFYQSAILGWKPFLNVDVSHKAFPKCNKVIDLIMELCPRCNLQEPLKPYDRETLDKFMRTLKVQYEIPNNPATKRVMRVNQLDRTASEARFKTDDGKQLTVQEYFEVEKRYKLKYPQLPCLWVGSKLREQKILLPVELCTILPGQVTNRAMTATQTSNMIKVAATSTTERKRKIMQSVNQARYNDDPSVREFGFAVSHDFAQIEARVLDSPMLRYNNRQEKPRKGVWRAQPFLNSIHMDDNWAIVSVDDRTNMNGLIEFTNMLVQSGKDVGMNIRPPRFKECVRLPYRKEKEELEKLFVHCKGLLLVIVIIPTDNKDTYNYVKQVAELKVGTLTQCIKGRNVFRPKPATVGNILLKINAKLNGINHALNVRPRCLERPCMIMGADVTHPSPESRGTVPSVAAVTASHDSQAFQYNICWRLQPPTQEIIADLENIVKEHLMFFYTKNRQMKPERIIFFRDGVSEGQFETVLNSEVSTIRRACSKMGDAGTYKPNITFLVVQKRHHTRFFPINPNDSEDRNMNVPAGTVVDTEITHPTALDFYLVSHASIQGVARPTKYRMLWDDNDMNEDELEQLTYHLCHLFTRCTRSVSYPAPTYYAHLAAARAKVYCERRQINMDALERELAQLTIKEDVVKKLPMFFV